MDDPRSARRVRAAHLAAEHGDPLASASLLHEALAGLLREHARAGRRTRPRQARPAVRTAVSLLRERALDPPTLEELAAGHRGWPVRADARLPGGDRAAAARLPQPAPGPAGPGTARRRRAAGRRRRREAGFADQAHLTRHFKRIVGVPPGAYQRARQDRGRAAAAAITFKSAAARAALASCYGRHFSGAGAAGGPGRDRSRAGGGHLGAGVRGGRGGVGAERGPGLRAQPGRLHRRVAVRAGRRGGQRRQPDRRDRQRGPAGQPERPVRAAAGQRAGLPRPGPAAGRPGHHG